MANATEKRHTLKRWNEAFPALTPYKNQFLVQRNGPLLTGLCLDGTRDPRAYIPTYFLHNLLDDDGFVALSYDIVLTGGNYETEKRLKYGDDVQEAAQKLQSQSDIVRPDISFQIYLNRIFECFKTRRGSMVLQHIYFDILTVGSYLGDADFFRSKLDEACTILGTSKRNYMPPGIDAWRERVEQTIACDYEERIAKSVQELKLPALTCTDMAYLRTPDFLDFLQDVK
jgi:hypothetical protein